MEKRAVRLGQFVSQFVKLNITGGGIIGNSVCTNSSLICSQLGYCVTPESLNPPLSVIDTLRTFGTFGLRITSRFGLRVMTQFGLRITSGWGLRITEKGAIVSSDPPESNLSISPVTFGGKVMNSTNINVYRKIYETSAGFNIILFSLLLWQLDRIC